ncbi:MAG: amidase domain-containing protein [Eubacteriales bacterium]
MILEKEYIRERAVMYARKYALVRNPLFYSFAGIGGNCTNFVSQCVLAGSCVMNFAPIYGWYYLSTNRRSASWTGVDFFYNFMIYNEGIGPFGRDAAIEEAMIGDVIQLQNSDGVFYHTLIISKIENGEIYICANSNDALDRPLSSYNYASFRLIHIMGVRYDTSFLFDCFEYLYSPPISEAVAENPPESVNNAQSPTGETQNEVRNGAQNEGTPQNTGE